MLMKFIGMPDRIFPWLVTGRAYDVTFREELSSKGLIASIEGHSCPYSSMEAFKSNWTAVEWIEEFEVTCKVTKGKRVYYYTHPNYDERIVRCRDCKRLIPKGEEFFINGNKAEREACSLFSDHDIDYDWTSFFYVKPDDFCAWGERRRAE